jgi:hypothetical protein
LDFKSFSFLYGKSILIVSRVPAGFFFGNSMGDTKSYLQECMRRQATLTADLGDVLLRAMNIFRACISENCAFTFQSLRDEISIIELGVAGVSEVRLLG